MFGLKVGAVTIGHVGYAASCLVAAVLMVVAGYAHQVVGLTGALSSGAKIGSSPSAGAMNILVNISRGPIVDEEALIGALRSGQLAGAGLDVFDREPLPADHPFRSLENVVVTPHIGYVTEQGFRASWERMAEDVAAYLAGSPIRVVTDPADCPPMAPR